MYERSFINQICTNIMIVSRLKVKTKLLEKHFEGMVGKRSMKSELYITIADKHCKLAALRSLCSSPC